MFYFENIEIYTVNAKRFKHNHPINYIYERDVIINL